jgi:predicted nucleic acid-binding protein
LTIYADSSFVVSLYLRDVHSQEAHRRMSPRPMVWLTPINRSELAHSLSRHVFRARIDAATAGLAWSAFEQDLLQGVWIGVDLPESTWDASIDLARRYGPKLGVRTLDSLHVAGALELKSKQFWTFDERQARLAAAVGLDTNP